MFHLCVKSDGTCLRKKWFLKSISPLDYITSQVNVNDKTWHQPWVEIRIWYKGGSWHIGKRKKTYTSIPVYLGKEMGGKRLSLCSLFFLTSILPQSVWWTSFLPSTRSPPTPQVTRSTVSAMPPLFCVHSRIVVPANAIAVSHIQSASPYCELLEARNYW